MAAKKGKIPEHVKQTQKKFYNPQADHPIIKIFNEVNDPRKPSLTFSFPLTSILFMALWKNRKTYLPYREKVLKKLF